MLYICTKFNENLSKSFRVTELTRFPIFKFSKGGERYGFYNTSAHKDHFVLISKGNNSIKNVGKVMVLVLCISSDDLLYLYKVS